jgi:hypothetical protein
VVAGGAVSDPCRAGRFGRFRQGAQEGHSCRPREHPRPGRSADSAYARRKVARAAQGSIPARAVRRIPPTRAGRSLVPPKGASPPGPFGGFRLRAHEGRSRRPRARIRRDRGHFHAQLSAPDAPPGSAAILDRPCCGGQRNPPSRRSRAGPLRSRGRDEVLTAIGRICRAVRARSAGPSPQRSGKGARSGGGPG